MLNPLENPNPNKYSEVLYSKDVNGILTVQYAYEVTGVGSVHFTIRLNTQEYLALAAALGVENPLPVVFAKNPPFERSGPVQKSTIFTNPRSLAIYLDQVVSDAIDEACVEMNMTIDKVFTLTKSQQSKANVAIQRKVWRSIKSCLIRELSNGKRIVLERVIFELLTVGYSIYQTIPVISSLLEMQEPIWPPDADANDSYLLQIIRTNPPTVQFKKD